MKGTVVFLVVLLFVTTAGAPGVQSALGTPDDGKPRYIFTSTEMGVYRLITPVVNESITGSRAMSMFSLQNVVHEFAGKYEVIVANRTFEMDSRDGSMWYADYSKLWNVSSGNQLPSKDSCKIIADNFLAQFGLLPSSGQFSGFGSTNATGHNQDTGETRSKILHYTVNYEFKLSGYPVTGPGAKISISICDGGQIVGLDWNWREVQLEKTLPVISLGSLLDAYGLSQGDVKNYSLGYYAGCDDQYDEFLFPAYSIELNGKSGDNEFETPPDSFCHNILTSCFNSNSC